MGGFFDRLVDLQGTTIQRTVNAALQALEDQGLGTVKRAEAAAAIIAEHVPRGWQYRWVDRINRISTIVIIGYEPPDCDGPEPDFD